MVFDLPALLTLLLSIDAVARERPNSNVARERCGAPVRSVGCSKVPLYTTEQESTSKVDLARALQSGVDDDTQ